MSSYSNEEIYERCPDCNGSGLVKIEPFVCIQCKQLGILSCMYCENIDKSKIGECPRCRGCGRDKYKNSK